MKQLQKLILRIFMTIICSCIFLTARTQSYYYLQAKIPAFKNNTELHYKILLSVLADGSAKARIQYNSAQNKFCLYELSMSDTSFAKSDTMHRYLVINAEPIPLLENDSTGFKVPRFVFVKQSDNTGSYFVPSSIETENQKGLWLPVVLESSQQKSYNDLARDEPFVSSFYFESDPFYEYIFSERTRAIPLMRSEKLFLIIVANTNDPTVGASAQKDLQNISNLFKGLAQNLGITKIFPVYISGSNYSKIAVEGALAALENQKPSGKDIVVFYFSGHGFRLQGDKSMYPRMSYRTAKNKENKEVGENISLEEVYKRIKGLKPGVTLVLGDCCNADIFENPVLGTDVLRSKGGGVLGDFNLESGNKLFFPPLPVAIIIGSVKQGHLSVGHPEIGGYYTHFFINELEKNLWGFNSFQFPGKNNASWLRMLLTAREKTYWKSKAKQCGKTENDRCIQEAEMEVNPPQ